jgi:hypothetical protein
MPLCSREHAGESFARGASVCQVCVFIPRFGVSAVDSVVNIVLRSTDELQRAAAAQALAAWVRCRDFAEEIWAKGSELIIDLLHVDAAINSNGLYYAVQALAFARKHFA